jgi:DNA polymerase V
MLVPAVAEMSRPALAPPVQSFPVALVGLSAGFPSPAQDYEDKRLDINQFLVRNPNTSFIFKVKGDSMRDADIFNGDMLVVDRSIEAQHGNIVVAFVNGERLVKRLCTRGGPLRLEAAHPHYPTIVITDAMEMQVWGVVVSKFKRLAG